MVLLGTLFKELAQKDKVKPEMDFQTKVQLLQKGRQNKGEDLEGNGQRGDFPCRPVSMFEMFVPVSEHVSITVLACSANLLAKLV